MESHKIALDNSFNHFNEKKIKTIIGKMWPRKNVLVKRVHIVHLALSGGRGSSSSLMDSSANWLKKELMLALVTIPSINFAAQ